MAPAVRRAVISYLPMRTLRRSLGEKGVDGMVQAPFTQSAPARFERTALCRKRGQHCSESEPILAPRTKARQRKGCRSGPRRHLFLSFWVERNYVDMEY